ncbi:hypothetical protein FSW04_18520 [Baekduia soli]|uniref:MBL fold metallo-hydrolase n=1 Tax=Baekduia soli TaxID=496014 RepID=A0A5B8U8T7_9ACTN|nr:hypothetical protein [Baekduia soli]QEC49367.1 hypothetical protein FSW04_18520 [Baekduia soli]
MTTMILEHELGLTWVMPDAMQRASHALTDDGRVWLIDPVDDEAALARVGALDGEPAGVLQLLDRHNRDCAAIAARLGVAHHVVPEVLADSPFTPRRVIRNRLWKEVALWWPARAALVVAEVVGCAPAFTLGAGPVGVHPARRLLPPRDLRELAPEHLLVGHGPPRHGPQTTQELATAIDRSVRDVPRLVLSLPSLIRSARQG